MWDWSLGIFLSYVMTRLLVLSLLRSCLGYHIVEDEISGVQPSCYRKTKSHSKHPGPLCPTILPPSSGKFHEASLYGLCCRHNYRNRHPVHLKPSFRLQFIPPSWCFKVIYTQSSEQSLNTCLLSN